MDDLDDGTHKKRKLNNQELCEWTGSLLDMRSHQKQCPLQLISCGHCERDMLQRELEQHHETCTQFPVACTDCHEDGILRSSMETHVQNECPMTMVPCPQKCGKQLQRRNQEMHITDACPQTMIDCEFNDYGCSGRFKREDEIKHNESASVTHGHLCKMADKVDELTEQNAKQQTQIDKQTLQMDKQQSQIEKLKQTISVVNEKAILDVTALNRIHEKMWARLEKLES
eukprot:70979_1